MFAANGLEFRRDSPDRRVGRAATLSNRFMVVVAQLVEHQVVILRVAGSSPVGHPRNKRAPRQATNVAARTTHASLAQRQSNGLLIRRFSVRIRGEAP
jgi:hypothetical protein